MRQYSVCQTKKSYKTFEEAEDAAARCNDPMEIYHCGDHFHLTHADPSKRIGIGQKRKYRRCPSCKKIYPRWRVSDQWKHFNNNCLRLKK